MKEDEFLESLEENGKRVYSVFKRLTLSGEFLLEPTDRGYHLCLSNEDKLIKIVQVWPRPKNWLETRMQFIEDFIVLTDDEKKSIKKYFAQIGFKPTKGQEGNMRWVFLPKGGLALEESELDRLSNNLQLIAKILRKSMANAI